MVERLRSQMMATIDGRRKQLVVERSGSTADPKTAKFIVLGRQTRSAGPTVFYSLADLDIETLEKEREEARKQPLPSSESSTKTTETNGSQNQIDSDASDNSSVFDDDDSMEAPQNDPPNDPPPPPPLQPITGDGALLPEPFHGRQTDNAEVWLSYLNRYATYKHLPDHQKLDLFKVLLRGTASDWLAAVPNNVLADLEQFTEAFTARFQDNDLLKYRSARDLFHTKQIASQSVDDYVTTLLKTAAKIGHKPEDDIIRYAILAGLRPHIASQVLMTNPNTTALVIERARLAELAAKPEPQTVDTISDEVQKNQVQQLCDDMARMKLKMADIRAIDVGRTPSQSPTRRRVTFNTPTRSASTSPARGYAGQVTQMDQQRQWNNNYQSRFRGRQQPQLQDRRTPQFPRYQNTATFNERKCYACGIPGHIARNCRRSMRGRGGRARRPQF